MKTMLPKIVASAALVMLASAHAGKQYIRNGGFESGLKYWTQTGEPGGTGGWYLYAGQNAALPPLAGSNDVYSWSFSKYMEPTTRRLTQGFNVPRSVGYAQLTWLEDIMAANDDPGDLIPPPPQEQTFDVYLLDSAGVPICDEQGNRLSLRGQGPFINVEALHPLETFTQSADLTLLLQAHVGETLTLVFEFYALNGIIEAHVDEVDLSISSKARTP